MGALGLPLAGWPTAWKSAYAASASSRSKSCIFLFLYGGPSQLDTWDLKPDAPAEIRGEFKPISTTVPGTRICEHLPRLARLAKNFTIVRSLQHNNRNHSPASGWALTGANPHTTGDPKKPPGRNDPPALGSVAARIAPTRHGVPSFVQLPARLFFDPGLFFLGQAAGWLGATYDPLLIEQDPNAGSFCLEQFAARPDVTSERWSGRGELLRKLSALSPGAPLGGSFAEYQRRALEMFLDGSGPAVFDLSVESSATRDRYGRTMLGQSCLLARRLVECGVRWVTIADCAASGLHQWDTHAGNFSTLKNVLLPRLDQAASTLLLDLDDRGLLEDTVVYIGGEFGRTPRIGVTSAGGAEPDGRDHWSDCYSGLLAGGLTQPGQVVGSSDRYAAYPATAPISPDDLGATILQAMGLDPSMTFTTFDGRPVPATTGTPVAKLIS